MTGLILVSGLGRCGSSLLMQMLSAGGWPVFAPEVARWPSFEHPANMGSGRIPEGASGLLKWLDPHVQSPPEGVRASIVLRRNPEQQARSFLKFLAALGLPTIPGPFEQVFGHVSVRRIAESYVADQVSAEAVLGSRGRVLLVEFEDLVRWPRVSLERIATFVGEPLDILRAAAELRERSSGSDCLPYLLEAELVADPRAGGAGC